MDTPTSNRRQFLKTTAGAGLVSLHPFSLFSQSPLRKLVVAVAGVRSRGKALAEAFAVLPDCEVKYVIDVDQRTLAPCLEAIKGLQSRKAKGIKDFRTALDDKEVDILAIATPDHWHAPMAILACQAGKHVYVEKPCSHTPREGELLVEAAQKYKRVVQLGTQRRNWSQIVEGIQELHNGIIGDVYFAKGWYANTRGPIGYGKEVPVPDYLDFDLWQGPAPRRPYLDNLHPYNWHWFWHWGTGEMLNNGTHMVDLMRWGMQVEYPEKVSSSGGRFHYKDDWETPDTQTVSYEFGEGKNMLWESRSCNGHPIQGSAVGVCFYGTKGSMVIPGGNEYTIYDNERTPNVIKSGKAKNPGSDTARRDILNTVGPGRLLDIPHVEDFLAAIRDGKTPEAEIAEGHTSTLLCQLGNIAYRTGNTLNIDIRNGHILEDQEAMSLWTRKYEEGWEVE